MILCIETATIACSVALSDRGKVLAKKETQRKNSHSEVITVFIYEVMKKAGVNFGALQAVAVSKGPGSYTGLRIGVSTAKGLCSALEIPLISVPTLQAMAGKITNYKLQITKESLLCPMIDARRMEVYYAVYDMENREILPTAAEIITQESFGELLKKHRIVFFGDGAEKCRGVISHENVAFIDGIMPSAADMSGIAYEKFLNKFFEDTAYFEPFYLKDFVAKKPNVKGLH